MGVKNEIVWSEIGSGFGEQDGTLPPRIPFPDQGPKNPGGGGALGYFLGGYVPPGTPNWHPVLKKIFPKIDTPF